uniref:FBA_2 domain-containing protein n=1 Tax=Caenorhabditis tropicalis TaxID=1561998 RepID=A0A1I7U2U9_9PELO
MEFDLYRLPDLPKILVIQLMTIPERIKLAISSQKIEIYLSRLFKKPAFSVYEIDLRGKSSFISIDKDKFRLFMSPLRLEYEEATDITEEDVKPWVNEKCTMIENTLNVFTRLQKVFPYQYTSLCATLNEIEPTTIHDLLLHPCVASLTGLNFYGGIVPRHDLHAVMEWKQENAIQFITFLDNEFPSDYRHPNAFRFSGVMYGDARWIHLKDLLSMRNMHRMVLGNNNLSMEDLNTFIKYWINCDEDMCKYLYIGYKHVNLSVLLEDVTVLKGFRSGNEFYIIASNSIEKQLLMTIRLVFYPDEPGRQEIEFSVQLADRPHKLERGGTFPSWAREYRILGRMARKRWLEKRRIAIETGEESLAKELCNLEEELDVEEVRMIDGFMTVQEKL